jgi:cell division protein FtsW (lipid II flippase)
MTRKNCPSVLLVPIALWLFGFYAPLLHSTEYFNTGYVLWTAATLIAISVAVTIQYQFLFNIRTWFAVAVVLTGGVCIWTGNLARGTAMTRFVDSFSMSIAEFLLITIIPIGCFLYQKHTVGGIALLNVLLLAAIECTLLVFIAGSSHGCLLLISVIALLIIFMAKNRFDSDKDRSLQIVIAILFCDYLAVGIIHLLFSYIGLNEMGSLWDSFVSRGHSDPLGVGYQSVIAQEWLSASPMIGPAPNVNGMAIENALPYAARDFSIVCHIVNYGWLIGIAICTVMTAYLISLWRLVNRQPSALGRYISLGCWLILAIKFIVGVAVNFSWIPTIGISVPFISHDPAGNLLNLALTAIIVASLSQKRDSEAIVNHNNISKLATFATRIRGLYGKINTVVFWVIIKEGAGLSYGVGERAASRLERRAASRMERSRLPICR